MVNGDMTFASGLCFTVHKAHTERTCPSTSHVGRSITPTCLSGLIVTEAAAIG